MTLTAEPENPLSRRLPPRLPPRRLCAMVIAIVAAAQLCLAIPGEALADVEPNLPRFVSIRAGEVNMRTGPGSQYPVDFVYRRQDLPVQIIAEFDTWRRIRDVDGDIGWVHQTMLSGRRTVMILGPDIGMMRAHPMLDAGVVARLEPGVIAALDQCESGGAGKWCRIEASGHGGWIQAVNLWGVSSDD